jgi:AmmeMemoRadiSam system protein B
LNIKKKVILIAAIVLLLIAGSFSFIKLSNGFYENTVCSGVTPHHLLARDVITEFFQYTSKHSNLDTIIILSPDHFNKYDIFGDNFITVKSEDFSNIQINTVLLKKLSQNNPIAFSDAAVAMDHGVMNLIPFVKKYFPRSKVVPFLIPQSIDYPVLNKFTESLNMLTSKRTLVIASVDFSHYLPKNISDFHDVKSIRTLMNFEKDDFDKIEVDSWQSLYIARYFAQIRRMECPHIIAHKNANDYVKDTTLYSTTSYFSVAFGKGKPKKFLSDTKTILFVGDIMLGRTVGNLIERNRPLYPFEKIRRALRGIDFVVGNLEGPISKTPVQFPKGSLKFCFKEEVVKGLSEAHFNLLSLANNHTFNMGEKGLDETRDILKSNEINFVGDPIKASPEFCFTKGDIAFLAFNTINNFNYDDIMQTIKTVRKENPDKFLIVIFHWGFEYEKRSLGIQRDLAHRAMDNGADLIIGSHPHVVQEIELYKPKGTENEKLIFYSLGNFVFDQYFSRETQQGLAVGLELSENKEIFRLFPVKSDLSQPELMNATESKAFLDDLSKISSKSLQEEIKKGIIEIKRYTKE